MSNVWIEQEKEVAELKQRISKLEKLLKESPCPNMGLCDGEGTIARFGYGGDGVELEPCQWCHTRDELLGVITNKQ